MIDRNDVPAAWAKAGPLVRRALDKARGEYVEADILASILSGNMQLWLDDKNCIVTQIIRYPQKLAVRIVTATGEIATGALLVNEVKKWAVSIGADRIEEVGRKGWEKVAKNHGFEEAYTMMIMRLDK